MISALPKLCGVCLSGLEKKLQSSSPTHTHSHVTMEINIWTKGNLAEFRSRRESLLSKSTLSWITPEQID